MKALLKLIFLGLVAGAAWKYLDENNISVSAKLSEAKVWVIGQIDEIKAASEPAPDVKENSSPEPAWSPSESETAGRTIPSGEYSGSYSESGSRTTIRNQIQVNMDVKQEGDDSYQYPSNGSSTRSRFSSLTGDEAANVEWIKNATREYSPESWMLLMLYDELPQVGEAPLVGGQTSVSQKPADAFFYLEGTSRYELLQTMSTNVHEIAHGYFRQSLYPYVVKNNLKMDYKCAQMILRLSSSKSFYIDFREEYLFPSSELARVIPSNLRSSRYDTYIEGESSTQTEGVIGLLNELNAYYLGSKFSYEMLQAYREAEESDARGVLTWVAQTQSEMSAFYEFDFFIKEYLLYMKGNHPSEYNQLKSYAPFAEAYGEIRTAYEELIGGYLKRVRSEVDRINSDGIAEASLKDENLWITDKSTGRSKGTPFLSDDVQTLVPVLESDRYNEVLSDFL